MIWKNMHMYYDAYVEKWTVNVKKDHRELLRDHICNSLQIKFYHSIEHSYFRRDEHKELITGAMKKLWENLYYPTKIIPVPLLSDSFDEREITRIFSILFRKNNKRHVRSTESAKLYLLRISKREEEAGRVTQGNEASMSKGSAR